jgi:drug/metabolite transporter (DMT)-like permease
MKWDWNKRDVLLIILIGVVGDAVSIVTQETGTWLSSAQMGSVITAATPTFMLVFAWWILKERITVGNGVSIVLATVGVLLIVGIHVAGRNALLGSLSLVVAAITWALMSVLIKLVSPRFNAYQIAVLAAIVAVILLTPYVLSRPSVLAGIPFSSPRVWGSFLYLGAVSTSMAFVMWTRGVQILGPADSGLYFLFQPVVGTLLGWLVLGEAVSWGFVVGTALIAVSIWASLRFGGAGDAGADGAAAGAADTGSAPGATQRDARMGV